MAFVLALINLAKRASSPAIDVLASNGDPDSSLLDPAPRGVTTAPGIVIIRLAAPLFFANGSVFAEAVKKAVTRASGVRNVVLDLEAVTDVDVTGAGAEAFNSLKVWWHDNGVALSLSRPRSELVQPMRDLGVLDDERLYATNRAALADLGAPPSVDGYEKARHPWDRSSETSSPSGSAWRSALFRSSRRS